MEEFATSSKISRLTHSSSFLPAEYVNPLRVLALWLYVEIVYINITYLYNYNIYIYYIYI